MMLERRQGRELDASLLASPPNRNVDPARRARRTQWLNILATNALPVAAALTLAWAATIALVVISEVFSLNLVPGGVQAQDNARSATLRLPLLTNSADNTVTARIRR